MGDPNHSLFCGCNNPTPENEGWCNTLPSLRPHSFLRTEEDGNGKVVTSGEVAAFNKDDALVQALSNIALTHRWSL